MNQPNWGRRGTTPECIFIGGHRPGFDAECGWCCAAKRSNYGVKTQPTQPPKD